MTEIKSDTNPDKRKRDKPDNYLDNWIERQSLIESAIPIIGKMHRKNVRILLYGAPLMTLSVIEIMQLHRKVREAEEKISNAINSMPHGITMWDKDMKLVRINDFGNRIWKKGKINLKTGSSYEDYMRQSKKNKFLILL